MKRSYTCQPKIYLRSKTPYFSQIPTILNLFNLKTKVKLMVKKQNYVAIFLAFLETVNSCKVRNPQKFCTAKNKNSIVFLNNRTIVFILKPNAARVRRMKERLLQQEKFDETRSEENKDQSYESKQLYQEMDSKW